MASKGGILITPTSIASTGAGNSSSINTNGSVTFSTCATLSLNGVFSADYDNYMIVRRSMIDTDDTGYVFRLRAAGTDNSTASSYVVQRLYASGTAVGADRQTASSANNGIGSNDKRDGQVLFIYGPHLAQPTAFRPIHVGGFLDAYIDDYAGTHNQSTSYDGITFYTQSNTMSGLIAVYGMRK